MIRAIVFDIGGVLIDNPWPQMLSHYASRLNVSEWDLEKFLKESKLMNDWPKGVITESKFWREICNNLDCHLPTSESLWLDGFKLAYRKKPEVFKLIETLQKRGFLIGLLSNTEQPVAEFLKRENFPDLDAFICSCDIGEIKPNPFIYEEMLKKLNLKPNEVVFIDDLKENVEGAKKVGIYAIQFTNFSEFQKELSNLL